MTRMTATLRQAWVGLRLLLLMTVILGVLYPLAVQLNALAWFGLIELLGFVAILAVAYVYIWRKGALEWR